MEIDLTDVVATAVCPDCDGDGRRYICDVCFNEGEIEVRLTGGTVEVTADDFPQRDYGR